MSISPICGPYSNLNIYRKTRQNNNGEEYVIDNHKKTAQLQKLDAQKKRHEISEGTYELRKKVIEEAPKVFHTQKNGFTAETPLKTDEEDTSIIKKLASFFVPAQVHNPVPIPDNGQSSTGQHLNILA